MSWVALEVEDEEEKMRRLLVIGLLFWAFGASVYGEDAYSDSFEGPVLNPYWTPSISRGALSFTPAAAHSGLNGAQFDTTADSSGQKTVQLTHQFGVPVYGAFSVWVFDTGAGAASSNYFRFFASPTPIPANGWGAQILTHDGAPDPTYTVMSLVTGETASSVARTQAWHHWEIDVMPTGLTELIDGQAVLTSPTVAPISNVSLMLTAPGFRPAWTGYYDDFSFTPAPEPGTLGFIAAVGVGMGCVRRARKKLK